MKSRSYTFIGWITKDKERRKLRKIAIKALKACEKEELKTYIVDSLPDEIYTLILKTKEQKVDTRKFKAKFKGKVY